MVILIGGRRVWRLGWGGRWYGMVCYGLWNVGVEGLAATGKRIAVSIILQSCDDHLSLCRPRLPSPWAPLHPILPSSLLQQIPPLLLDHH